jgi:hypothetical protein
MFRFSYEPSSSDKHVVLMKIMMPTKDPLFYPSFRAFVSARKDDQPLDALLRQFNSVQTFTTDALR